MEDQNKQINILKGLLRTHDIGQKELAQHLGIGVGTCNRKINNYTKWTVEEALKIKELLHKKYIEELFFER